MLVNGPGDIVGHLGCTCANPENILDLVGNTKQTNRDSRTRKTREAEQGRALHVFFLLFGSSLKRGKVKEKRHDRHGG